MDSDVTSWLGQLQRAAAQARFRILLRLEGSDAFCRARVALLNAHGPRDALHLDAAAVNTNQARGYLGREFSLIVLEAACPPAPELLAILAGTLRAGGLLVIVRQGAPWCGAFDAMLDRALQQAPEVLHWREGEPLPQIPAWPDNPQLLADDQGCLTPAQRAAFDAVKQVALGHRRRPLVIRAGRGRGKSALLGLAAASLLQQGKTRVLVTAPLRAAVEPLFTLAWQQLSGCEQGGDVLRWQGAELRFLPPDRLLRERPCCDLLLVDEAAAIPARLLQQLLTHYARVVYATTTQGYEGSGRGFEVRFIPYLQAQAPGWRSAWLSEPIRWALGDPLDDWLNRTLLLDDGADSDSAGEAAAAPSPLTLAWYPAATLVDQPALLRELFTLLVLAHYQTSPNDLRELLQGEGARVALARRQGRVVGVLFCLDESPLAAELAEAVWLGRRRPAGTLLAQTLIAQCGRLEAGQLSSRRIVRIAVHPGCQREGVGSQMLAWLANEAGVDWLGSSFGADDTLLPFWFANGYQPLRLGLRADAASGCPALLVGLPLSVRARDFLAEVHRRFSTEFLDQLADSHRDLPGALLALLLSRTRHPEQATPFDVQEAAVFALGGRGLAQVRVALRRVVLGQPDLLAALSDIQRTLLLAALLQYRGPADLESQLDGGHEPVRGKKAWLQQLRSGVRALLRQPSLALLLSAALRLELGKGDD